MNFFKTILIDLLIDNAIKNCLDFFTNVNIERQVFHKLDFD